MGVPGVHGARYAHYTGMDECIYGGQAGQGRAGTGQNGARTVLEQCTELVLVQCQNHPPGHPTNPPPDTRHPTSVTPWPVKYPRY